MPKELNSNQVGTQRRSHVNEPKTRPLTGYTKFPMSYRMPNTARYGHLTPFYYQHSRGDDTIPLFSEHKLRTYTLSSPLEADVYMNKSYFSVDFEAIYPRNYQQMFVSPSKGDDVPDDCRAVVKNLLYCIQQKLYTFNQIDEDLFNSNKNQILTDWIMFVFFMESVVSNGSLFAEFDIHLSSFVKGFTDPDYVTPDSFISFDEWFDRYFALSLYDGDVLEFSIERNDRVHNFAVWDNDFTRNGDGITYIPLRRAIELMRDNDFSITRSSQTAYDDQFAHARDRIMFDIYSDDTSQSEIPIDEYPINLEVILAYQLGCAQFFTDSHVDFVYNAQLYRDVAEAILFSDQSTQGTLTVPFFTYNGTKRLYDILSGHIIDQVLLELSQSEADEAVYRSHYDFLRFLFNHRNSLRFGDYFVTGRPNPLGIGDVSVDTSQASVSVVDITRNIQFQRFLNSVNLARQDIASYAREVLGLDDAGQISYQIPGFISHKSMPIGGFEVENTGNEQREQNSITTILKSSNNNHAFEVKTKRPCIIIGVYSFDVSRVYTHSFDRMHMHVDRYDDFIPQLEYTGDQSIYRRELNSKTFPEANFAYSVKYMEYKIRHNYAAGGAIEKLNSWFFTTDGTASDPLMCGRSISPDFIRSQPTEFDRFYTKLTGYSLGTYFHFVVTTINHQELTRKMHYAPEPLK